MTSFDGRQLALQRRERRQQRRVDEHQLVLGVVDDELELLRKQPRVQRVQHGAHAGDRVIQLEMPVIVPGERPDPVTGLDARRLQRVGELARAPEDLGPGACDAAGCRT